MLALGMAFVAKPRVLLIDELSLGLAPVIVGQLLPIVRRLAEDGVAVILVEQSVNVALTVAERAYFMERGTHSVQRTDRRTAERDPTCCVRCSSPTIAAPRPCHRCGGRGRTNARPATATLEVVGLGRSFGGNQAVNDVSFDVADREIVGMIGPNGAGKTTLFDLISGYVAPTRPDRPRRSRRHVRLRQRCGPGAVSAAASRMHGCSPT